MEGSEDYKKALGVEDMHGALASQIFIGSPAQKSGIKPGDFIVKIDGHEVKNVEQAQREVGRIAAGKKVDFEVFRNGEKLVVPVTIEERSEKVSADNSKLWPGFIAVPLTEDVRKELELDSKVSGVAVTNIAQKSPAASLRLQEGDVITSVNGKSVKNLKEFYTELSKADKSVNFDIYSNGGTITTGTYKF